MVRLTLLIFAAAALVPAQTPGPAAGLEPSWDIAVVLNEIGGNASRLLPALSKLDPQAWAAKGASETYAEQLRFSREQASAVADAARSLARNPERLAVSLELTFRMEELERMLLSVQEAARRYQGPGFAQAIEIVYAEGGANRDRFRRYIVNLASERERQFEVMDKEAQRCRATLVAPTPPPRPTGRKK
jgi:hypothetical protein